MKPRIIFALIVRVAGLISLLYFVATSVIFFGAGLHWPFLLRAVAWAIVSLWLLRGAPQLVRFAYRDTDPDL